MIEKKPGGLLNLPLKINLKEVGDEFKRGLGELRTWVVDFLKQRDPVLEVVALPGGFRRAFASTSRFAAVIPGDSAAELVITNSLNNFLNLYNLCLIGRLILTWFPQAPQAVVTPLSTLCDPYLNLFRGLIPPVANIDFSPILAFLILNVFTSTAAALPAEIPQELKDEAQSANAKKEAEMVDEADIIGRHHFPAQLHQWARNMRRQMMERRSKTA
ncbi:hypothetical protein BSKO_06439 [Bryopsis sp. KO-2023]|nr:hypothetical protein BSKO_06439 [Bryopsis sp. KO-2023]